MSPFQFQAGIIGAGAWGTAIAQTIGWSEHPVLLWSPEKEVVTSINRRRENARYLPGILLAENLTATNNLEDVAKNCRILFICCPANANTEVAAAIQPFLTDEHIVVICSKGLRESDGALLSDVWRETAPNFKNIAVLSGPSFASELAERKLTAVTVAAANPQLVKRVNQLFTVPWFRIYFSTDMIGVQVGGALKNVIAIATGISDGLELGGNARTAILCRGLAEMARFGKAYGARPETFMGLAGVGDMMLSACSPLSRHYRLGFALAKGRTLPQALSDINDDVEGVHTCRIITEQAVSRGIDLGVIMMVDGVLQGDVTPDRGIELLTSRPRINEFEH